MCQTKNININSNLLDSKHKDYPKKDAYQLTQTALTKKSQSSQDALAKTNLPFENNQMLILETPSNGNSLVSSKCSRYNSMQSDQRINGMGTFKSLWDANKTISIVSETESHLAKIEESEIVQDFFNSPHGS